MVHSIAASSSAPCYSGETPHRRGPTPAMRHLSPPTPATVSTDHKPLLPTPAAQQQQLHRYIPPPTTAQRRLGGDAGGDSNFSRGGGGSSSNSSSNSSSSNSSSSKSSQNRFSSRPTCPSCSPRPPPSAFHLSSRPTDPSSPPSSRPPAPSTALVSGTQEDMIGFGGNGASNVSRGGVSGVSVSSSYSLQTIDPSSPPASSSTALVSGAAGAMIGFALSGPLLGAMIGICSAYTTATASRTSTTTTTTHNHQLSQFQAENSPGLIRDVARALLDVSLVAQNKMVALSHKHHHTVVDGTKRVVSDAWRKAQEWNRRHRIWKTITDISLWSCKTAIVGIEKGLGFVWHHGSSSRVALIGSSSSAERTTAGSHQGEEETTTLYPVRID